MSRRCITETAEEESRIFYTRWRHYVIIISIPKTNNTQINAQRLLYITAQYYNMRLHLHIAMDEELLLKYV